MIELNEADMMEVDPFNKLQYDLVENLYFMRMPDGVKQYFIKYNIRVPQSINKCAVWSCKNDYWTMFKSHLRLMITSEIQIKNYYIGSWGGIVCDEVGQSPFLAIDNKKKEWFDEWLLRKNIDLSFRSVENG